MYIRKMVKRLSFVSICDQCQRAKSVNIRKDKLEKIPNKLRVIIEGLERNQIYPEDDNNVDDLIPLLTLFTSEVASDTSGAIANDTTQDVNNLDVKITKYITFLEQHGYKISLE